MERNYITLIIIFASIASISLVGFYASYLSTFPNYNQFSTVIHIHFVAFLCWLLLTIIQPVLINMRKIALHRKLGKLSYIVAPVMVVTMCLLVLAQTKRQLSESIDGAAITAIIGLLDILSFSIYYIIAMANRKNVRWHVAFILSATLIVLNPGMSRLLNQIQPGLGMLGAVLMPFIVPLVIIIYEKIKLKKPIFKSPYSLFFACWALEILILVTIPGTAIWQNLIQHLK